MGEVKISPGAIIVVGLGLGLAAVLGIAAVTWAAPPTPPPEEGIFCPYCPAGPFATLDDINEHIKTEHPGQPLLIHIEWE